MMRNDSSEKPSPAAQAFRCRVMANIHVPYIGNEQCQYWTERPQLIPYALHRAFTSTITRGQIRDVRKEIENFIWNADVMVGLPVSLDAKLLVIWFLRQSKNLTEEIFLRARHSDSRSKDALAVSRDAAKLVHNLNSSGARIRLPSLMYGLGVLPHLHQGISEDCGHLYFTHNFYDNKHVRHIDWSDATSATSGYLLVEIPDWVPSRNPGLKEVTVKVG